MNLIVHRSFWLQTMVAGLLVLLAWACDGGKQDAGSGDASGKKSETSDSSKVKPPQNQAKGKLRQVLVFFGWAASEDMVDSGDAGTSVLIRDAMTTYFHGRYLWKGADGMPVSDTLLSETEASRLLSEGDLPPFLFKSLDKVSELRFGDVLKLILEVRVGEAPDEGTIVVQVYENLRNRWRLRPDVTPFTFPLSAVQDQEAIAGGLVSGFQVYLSGILF